MLRFILRRLLWAIPILVLSSVAVFFAVSASVDPVATYQRNNPRASATDVQRYKESIGYDKSPVQRYTSWLGDFMRGDWGKSLKTKKPVWDDMQTALANSVLLGLWATVLGLSIGVGIGVVSAIKQYSWFDKLGTGVAFFGFSMPPFWFGLILQLVFAVSITKWLGWSEPFLPVGGVYPPGHSGFDPWLRFKHLILPGFVVAVQIIAIYSRYMRASLLDTLNADYIRTARSKGLKERVVMIRHAMRNALIPITTQAAIDVGGIFAGLIITEQIFNYNGMGKFFLTAYDNGDYPQILPWVMIVMAGVIFFNLVADLTYVWLDPRIRLVN